MKKFNSYLGLGLILISNFQPLMANAAVNDISIATFQLSGNVPTVFSLTARGYPGDMDLNPGSVVNKRVVGILHFKYNAAIDTLEVNSDVAGGVLAPGITPAFTAYSDNTLATDCAQIDNTKPALAAIDLALGDIEGAAMPAMSENDCYLAASWSVPAGIRAAGLYSMNITFTMTSI